MPRRFNYTNRRKIRREHVSIRLLKSDGQLSFDANLNLTDYNFDKLSPPPEVFLEAYRGASARWKRFSFGHVGQLQAPADRSLNEFVQSEGILFRVKVSGASGTSLGRLLGEADAIRPLAPNEQESFALPLILHVPADDIGDELWRVDFGGEMPLLKVNSKLHMGVGQFLSDPQYRAIYAPAVMRQVLTRILIVDRDTGDESDEEDWRQRWMRFARLLPGVSEGPEVFEAEDDNLEEVETWIDRAIEGFVSVSGLFAAFSSVASQESSP